jgi:hypothetical protein
MIQLLRDEVTKLSVRVAQLEKDRRGHKTDSLIPLTEDVFQDCVKHLTLNDVLKGPYGYAMFAIRHVFKDRLYCSDISRRKVLYKDDETNDIKADNGMLFLRVKFFSAIKERNKELLTEYKASVQDKIDRDWDNSEEEDDFSSNFVMCVCSELVRNQ